MLETMDLMEWDGNKWIIETNGTNQTEWAERIDGADKTYKLLESWWCLRLVDMINRADGAFWNW